MSLTLTEKLAALGVRIPAWHEKTVIGAADDWIQRGQVYAEGVRAWREELQHHSGLDKSKIKHLVHASRKTDYISEWDKRAVLYMLSTMNDQDKYKREGIASAISLVEAEGLSDAQLLGASIDLFNNSFIVTAARGINQLLKRRHTSAVEQIKIFALLTQAIPSIPKGATADFGCWKRSITFHQEAARLLHEACKSTHDDNQTILIAQLGRLSDAAWDQSIETSVRWKHLVTSMHEKEPVIAGMASIPSRRELLRVSLDSILPQVDQVELVLNGYGDIPEWLSDERINVTTDSEVGDHADNAKFLGMNRHKECIYFTVDDDILYPRDYTARLLDAISYYGGDVAVGVHGSLVDSRDSPFLNRRTHAFWKKLENDMPCSYVGTGTLAVRRSIMPLLPILAFSQTGASDLFLARFLKLHGIPVICVRRPEGWLRDLPNHSGPALWKEAQENHSMQDTLLKESGPWRVEDIMKRCQGKIVELLDKDIAAGLKAAFLVATGESLPTSISKTMRCSYQAQKAFRFYTGRNYAEDCLIVRA